jgi:hypothetical protein
LRNFLVLNIAIAVLSLPLSLLCQTPTKPVPAKWLHDGRLVVPELNFSIGSPTGEAKWFDKDDLAKVDGTGATAFVVDLGDGSRYSVMVLENSGKMGPADSDQFINGMRKTLPKDWQIQDHHFEASNVPTQNSEKFRVTIGLTNRSTYYAYGYIVPGNRSYQIITFSPAPIEPLSFSQFAHSFALINPIANTPLPNPSGLFLLWAFWGAIVNVRYVRRGGVRATTNEKIGLLVAVVFAIALIVLVAFRGTSAYSLGSLMATIGTVIFSLWEFARWRVRRKNPLSVPGFRDTQPQRGIIYTESELGAMKDRGDSGPLN